MIHIKEAKSEVILNTPTLHRTISIPIDKAVGHLLAENIIAPINLPPFDQSAVDGYAVKLASEPIDFYQLVSEIKTGEYQSLRINKKESVRIFTGGSVPPDADCVIMQENICAKENILTVKNITPKKGDNIRYSGSQIKKGEIAIEKGIRLSAASIGFLASLGIQTINVFDSPTISVIATGSELVPSGEPLAQGKIYESNTYMLQAALLPMKVNLRVLTKVKDDELEIKNTILKIIHESDIVILTGGISVGKYDLVKPILEQIGVQSLFYKVAQKPGKPLYVGKSGNTLIFGLPGNPAAVLTCFYEYVYPAIRKMQGCELPFLPSMKLSLKNNFYKKSRIGNFLKGKIIKDEVKILDGQESYILKSYQEADCLIYIPEEREIILAGELVDIHILPNY